MLRLWARRKSGPNFGHPSVGGEWAVSSPFGSNYPTELIRTYLLPLIVNGRRLSVMAGSE